MNKRIPNIKSWSRRTRVLVALVGIVSMLVAAATVRAGTAPDFTLSAAPTTQYVGSGGSGSYSVSIGPSNGFAGNVTLTAGNLPNGTSASWTFNGTKTNASSVVANVPTGSQGVAATLTIGGGQPKATTYSPTITATSGSITHQISPSFVVVGQNAANFTMSATPASTSVVQGQSSTAAIAVTRTNWTGSVTFGPVTMTSAQGATVSGVGASFNPSSTTGNASTLTLSVPAGTPAGYYTVTVNASGALSGSSTSSRQAAYTLVVQAATALTASGPSYGIYNAAINPPYIAAALSGTAATGSGGTITFKVFGPQASAPTSCSGGTTVGTASVSGNGTYHPSAGFTPGATGTYWWYASYSGDSYNNAVNSPCGSGMSSTVVQDYSISSNPSSQTALTDGTTDDSATYPIAVTPVNGFAGAVALTASGLPSGVSSSATASGVTLDIGTNVTPKSYSVTINSSTTVNGATVQRSTTVTLVVQASQPFNVSGNITSPLYPGAAAQNFTVTITNPNPFPIHVTSDAVVPAPVNAPGCQASWFRINLPNVPSGGLSVAAKSSSPVTASAQMIDVNAPQNACQGKTIALTYSGTYGK